MMRLQRVGRKNDPSYRIVVTDKRTGPKSNKHVAILGSYNSKMNQVQLKSDEAKEWIAKGVQLSPTVHNLLVSEKVIDGKKINVLPKKSPIVNEEAAAAEAAANEAPAEESAETTTEEAAPEVTDETPGEEPKEEAPATEAEAPTEETPAEEVKEELKEEAAEEKKKEEVKE